jgi:hypothetical protein
LLDIAWADWGDRQRLIEFETSRIAPLLPLPQG